MLKNSTSITHALQPLKYYYYKVSAAMFIACSLFVSYTAYKDPTFATRSRNAVLDGVTPIISAFARPADAISTAANGIRELVFIHDENAMLKEQNRMLLRWQAVALEALKENETLKKLAHYNENSNIFFVSSKLISETGGPFSRTALIASGNRDGVGQGMAVVNESGIIGRISSVANSSAKVTLLTDINSRIPVVSSETGERLIAAGTNAEALDILYRPEHSQLKAGEKVLTSGDGGAIPSGIVVGTVREKEGGKMVITPDTDVSRASFVGIVNYSRE